jgi:hypothetical protein
MLPAPVLELDAACEAIGSAVAAAIAAARVVRINFIAFLFAGRPRMIELGAPVRT